MADLLSFVNDFSRLLELAWVGWLVWAAAQIVWYWRGRTFESEEPLGEPAFEPAPRRAPRLLDPAPAIGRPLTLDAEPVTAFAASQEAPEIQALAKKPKRRRRVDTGSSKADIDLAGTISNEA